MSDTQEELQAGGETSPLRTMWFETHLGARYEMPDMTSEHITDAHRLLDAQMIANITVVNVSAVAMVIPKRIIEKAGVGDRCFWEAP